MKAPTAAWLVAGGATAFALWTLLRRRAGESLASAAGRSLGEGAVELASGTVEGIVDAGGALGEALGNAAGGGDVRVVPVEGRALWSVDRNLRRLQGRFTYPADGQVILSAVRTVEFVFEVQNQSGADQDVALQLDVDEWGLEPWRSELGTVRVPAFRGIIGRARRLLRSPLLTIGTSYTARLRGDGFLLAGPISFRVVV